MPKVCLFVAVVAQQESPLLTGNNSPNKLTESCTRTLRKRYNSTMSRAIHRQSKSIWKCPLLSTSCRAKDSSLNRFQEKVANCVSRDYRSLEASAEALKARLLSSKAMATRLVETSQITQSFLQRKRQSCHYQKIPEAKMISQTLTMKRASSSSGRPNPTTPRNQATPASQQLRQSS